MKYLEILERLANLPNLFAEMESSEKIQEELNGILSEITKVEDKLIRLILIEKLNNCVNIIQDALKDALEDQLNIEKEEEEITTKNVIVNVGCYTDATVIKISTKIDVEELIFVLEQSTKKPSKEIKGVGFSSEGTFDIVYRKQNKKTILDLTDFNLNKKELHEYYLDFCNYLKNNK